MTPEPVLANGPDGLVYGANTVERLLDAALETFAEIGFAAASVEDICRRGGFTRGAFYSSFRTKDELFGALFARETARNIALAETQLTGIEQEADPVTVGVDGACRRSGPTGTWVRAHRVPPARGPPPRGRRRAERHVAALNDRLTGTHRDGRRAATTLTLPADQLARAVLAVHDGVVLSQVPGPEPPPTTSNDPRCCSRSAPPSPDPPRIPVGEPPP